MLGNKTTLFLLGSWTVAGYALLLVDRHERAKHQLKLEADAAVKEGA